MRVLVSACLMGERVRYNGIAKAIDSQVLTDWGHRGYVVAICPEVDGGLPVPRLSSEIFNGDGGHVLTGQSKVLSFNGEDVTSYFLEGAKRTLALARLNNIKLAILKDGSPSCGKNYIYDGSFSGTQKQGKGVTAALLENKGIRVFSEREISEAEKYLTGL